MLGIFTSISNLTELTRYHQPFHNTAIRSLLETSTEDLTTPNQSKNSALICMVKSEGRTGMTNVKLLCLFVNAH